MGTQETSCERYSKYKKLLVAKEENLNEHSKLSSPVQRGDNA